MNAAVAAAMLIATVSTILATSPAPATAASGGAGPPQKWSLWPYKHVHLINELGSNLSMTVHCKGEKFLAKEEDLGVHYVGAGWEYTWRFKPGFFDVTKYSCYVAPVDGDAAVHMDFDAYVSWDWSIVEHKNNVYWAVKRDGVYMRDVTAGKTADDLRYIWARGKVDSHSVRVK